MSKATTAPATTAKPPENRKATIEDRLHLLGHLQHHERLVMKIAEQLKADLTGVDNLATGWGWTKAAEFGPRPEAHYLALRLARRTGEDAHRRLEDLNDEESSLRKEWHRLNKAGE